MGVYLEPMRRSDDGKRSKLRADTIDELHAFAADHGLDRAAFSANPTVDDLGYYDLTPRQRRQALRGGAAALEWSDAYQRISAQMVAGTRRVTTRTARFGVTRAPAPDPARSAAVMPASRPVPAAEPPTSAPTEAAPDPWQRRAAARQQQPMVFDLALIDPAEDAPVGRFGRRARRNQLA